MPPIRSARNRKPTPDGLDDIEDTLLEFGNIMKDAENASDEGKKRNEVLWPIFQIIHQRTYRPSLAQVRAHLLNYGNLNYWLTRYTANRLKIHLRIILRQRSYFEAALRLAVEE